jgi:hypothetical protein
MEGLQLSVSSHSGHGMLEEAATYSDRNVLSRVVWGPPLKSNMVGVLEEE